VNHNPGMPFFTCFRINELEQLSGRWGTRLFLISPAVFAGIRDSGLD